MDIRRLPPLQQAADIARRAEELAEDWIGGATERDVKDRAWQLGQEARDVHADRDADDRGQVIAAVKAVRLLIEAIRCATFSRGEAREQLKSILAECSALTNICAPGRRGS